MVIILWLIKTRILLFDILASTWLIFNKAIELKIKDFKESGILTNPFLDNLVFKKIRAILGGRMRFMLVGSAPMDPYLMNFLQCALSCKIVEGYGQTENCAGVLITSQYDRICQHLGGPGWNEELKLVDVDDLDYHSTDVDPETGISCPSGELCVRGPLLFKGYLADEENTKLALDKDGWLHTGDVAMVLTSHGNAIRIIDRVKNIFKLQQGEYVAPEKLENVYVDSEFIEQIFVYGDSYKNHLVSIIVPNKAKVVDFLKTIRKHNQKAYIVCAFGLMGDRLYPTICGAVDTYRSETGDTRITTVHLPEQDAENVGYGANYHPLESEHTKAADTLIPVIRDILK